MKMYLISHNNAFVRMIEIAHESSCCPMPDPAKSVVSDGTVLKNGSFPSERRIHV